MNSSDSDDRDILSDGHREFMRCYIEREEQAAKATMERFLGGEAIAEGQIMRNLFRDGCTGIVVVDKKRENVECER